MGMQDCQSEWIFQFEKPVLVVQAYGDLTADTFRLGRARIAGEAKRTQCDRVLVDMRPGRMLLTPAELPDVVREAQRAPYLQPVGMIASECDQTLVFRHALMMAARGATRMFWTYPYDALEWARLTALPPFKS